MSRFGRRLWADRTPFNRRPSFPAWRGDGHADVVVIGGGLAGSAAAYVLAAGGLDVVLLEADRLADGATAGGLGAILPEPDARFREVEAQAGRRAARVAWQSARRGALEFAAALRKAGARCDLAPATLLVNARTAAEAAALGRERTARRAAGVAARWLAPSAAAAGLGTASAGALRLDEAFVYDPVRAALALARAAEARGARIHERSEVRRTSFTRKDAAVKLAAGVITARGVVVATGDPGSLFPQIRRHVRRAAGYVAVTEPMPAAMRREAGPRRAVQLEAGARGLAIRWLPDDRVLVAGEAGAPVGTRQRERAVRQHAAELMYQFSRRYPVISGLPAGHAWDVPVLSSPDGLPWAGPHRNYPFHYFLLAFGWHGDALAWAGARSALRYFRGESRRDDGALGFAERA